MLSTDERTMKWFCLQAKNGCAEVMQTFCVYTWRPNLGEIVGFERYHRHVLTGTGSNKVIETRGVVRAGSSLKGLFSGQDLGHDLICVLGQTELVVLCPCRVPSNARYNASGKQTGEVCKDCCDGVAASCRCR